MKVERVVVRDMWSFDGKAVTTIEKFGDITAFIGKNNNGKSNVLRAINWIGKNGAYFKSNDSAPDIAPEDRYTSRERRYEPIPRLEVGSLWTSIRG